MKAGKRIIALFLGLILTFTGIQVGQIQLIVDVKADSVRLSGIEYDVKSDHADIIGYYYENIRSDVTVGADYLYSTNGDNYLDGRLPVISIEKEAFKNKKLTSVVIEKGIQSIGSEAFADNPDLSSIEIPASVTEIAEDAFLNCGNMTITCIYNSAAQLFAERHGIQTEVLYIDKYAELRIGEFVIINNGKLEAAEYPEGISYDPSINTLYFNGYDNNEDELSCWNMGDDFRINIEGDNSINSISGYDGTLTIDGNGTLATPTGVDFAAIYCDGNLNIQCKSLKLNSKFYGIFCRGNITIRNCDLSVDAPEGGTYGITLDYMERSEDQNIIIEDSIINIKGVSIGMDAQTGNLSIKDSTVHIECDNESGRNLFGIGVGWYDYDSKVYGGEFTLENSKIWCSLNGGSGYSIYYYKLNASEGMNYYTGTNNEFKLKSLEDAIEYDEDFADGRYELWNKSLLITPDLITEDGDVMYGDVDNNGVVDASDALDILKHAAKLQTLPNEQQGKGDVDQSGQIDASDALLVLKKAAKLMDFFPFILNEIFG